MTQQDQLEVWRRRRAGRAATTSSGGESGSGSGSHGQRTHCSRTLPSSPVSMHCMHACPPVARPVQRSAWVCIALCMAWRVCERTDCRHEWRGGAATGSVRGSAGKCGSGQVQERDKQWSAVQCSAVQWAGQRRAATSDRGRCACRTDGLLQLQHRDRSNPNANTYDISMAHIRI